MDLSKIIISRGKKAKVGPVHTMDITLDHLRQVFFPKNFYEKYHYLGAVPWHEEGDLFKVLKPLVLLMDLKARPWWCPRFFLRFLHLFGSDNSIVRVRNMRLHNLEKRLTKGFMFFDYKTKWEWYDLRISIAGDNELMYLADAIEDKFYREGFKQDLVDRIIRLAPEKKREDIQWKTTQDLKEMLDKLEDKIENL